ncbi:MAG TPA: glycosyltransferase [Phycisphaerales bacterium]|nr:glycosyltransferase [Phycisphaerales bacterium]
MQSLRLKDGGVTRAVIDLCIALAQRGHQVHTFTSDSIDAPADWARAPSTLPGKPTVHALPQRWQFQPEALDEVRTHMIAADVIHLDVPWDPVCYQLASLAYRLHKPYVFGIHGMLDQWTLATGSFAKRIKKSFYLHFRARIMLERAYSVLLASETEMQQSQRCYPRGRSTVIPLLVDLSSFSRLPGPQLAQQQFNLAASADPIILSLGRLDPIKRHDLLIHALAVLRDRHIPARLVIAGSGAQHVLDSLQSLTERCKLSDRVIFTGFVGGDLKTSLYQASTIFASASAHESFGLSIVEALICGIPAVTSRAVNIWKELELSGSSLITDLTPQSFADAFAHLLADPARRAAMSAAASPFIHNWLDLPKVVQQYEDLYRAAAASHS